MWPISILSNAVGKRPSRRVVLSLLLFVMVSQDITVQAQPSANIVRIRITNMSDKPFSKLIVQFPSGVEDYGALAAGASTEYRNVEVAYRYASVSVVADNQDYSLMAIDYMGETRLASGFFTYALDIDDRSLTFGFAKDSE